jgi:hypothetical protein
MLVTFSLHVPLVDVVLHSSRIRDSMVNSALGEVLGLGEA